MAIFSLLWWRVLHPVTGVKLHQLIKVTKVNIEQAGVMKKMRETKPF